MRCAYCHDTWNGGTVCAGCRAVYHNECAGELITCGTLGCEVSWQSRKLWTRLVDWWRKKPERIYSRHRAYPERDIRNELRQVRDELRQQRNIIRQQRQSIIRRIDDAIKNPTLRNLNDVI